MFENVPTVLAVIAIFTGSGYIALTVSNWIYGVSRRYPPIETAKAVLISVSILTWVIALLWHSQS